MENDELVIEVKKIGEDLKNQIKQIEGQVKESGKVSDDTLAQFKGLDEKLKAIEEKYGKDISDLALRVNKDGALFGGQEKGKDYYGQILAGLEEKVTKGGFGRGLKGDGSFEIPSGQGAMQLKAVGDMTNTNLSGGYASRDIRQNIVSLPYRKQRVRSLINVGSISSPVMDYLRNNSPFGEGGVAFQTEGALKAQIDFDFTLVTEPVKTIAVFAVVTKQMLSDIPRLASFLSNQLTNKWFDFEDNQILNGDGTGQNFNGLVTQATDYVKTPGTTANYYEYLIDAIAQIENANFESTGIVMNPLDFVRLLTYKGTTGEFSHPGLVYGADNILRIYGTQIVKNNAIAKGTGLVGDFTQAELLVRDGLTFDMSYDDSDNFRKNKVTLRLEAREGFAVYQPTAFRAINFVEIAS